MTTQSQEKKFYTPSIEDFHVGFEYEHLWNDKWELSIYGEEETLNFDRDGEWFHPSIYCTQFTDLEKRKNNYRVKYLDEEDILAEGWNETTDQYSEKCYEHQMEEDMADAKLYFDLLNHTVNIYLGSGTMFSGTIRNRSELRQIMRMIGITT